VAVYQAGELASMTELQPVPASRFQGLDYVRWIVHVAASSLPAGATTAGICLSSYLDKEGQPARYAAGGRFAGIDDEIARLHDWLTREVSQTAGRVVSVSLFHDASAAGVGLAPSPSAAVIMLGTALGVGFPLASVGSLRPVAPDFSFVEARLSP
jgi:hypothetical protein